MMLQRRQMMLQQQEQQRQAQLQMQQQQQQHQQQQQQQQSPQASLQQQQLAYERQQQQLQQLAEQPEQQERPATQEMICWDGTRNQVPADGMTEDERKQAIGIERAIDRTIQLSQMDQVPKLINSTGVVKKKNETPKKQSLCKFVDFPNGCRDGDKCEWSHSQQEVHENSIPWKCVFCGFENGGDEFICGGRGAIHVTPGCKKHRNLHNREVKRRAEAQWPGYSVGAQASGAPSVQTGVHALPKLTSQVPSQVPTIISRPVAGDKWDKPSTGDAPKARGNLAVYL